MQTPFSNNGYFVSRNGKQSQIHRERLISFGVKRSFISNPKTNILGMEAKIILTWIGFGTYIGGILLNLTNWKSDILFLSGCAFMLLKFIRLTIKTWQSYKREEIEQQILKKRANDTE